MGRKLFLVFAMLPMFTGCAGMQRRIAQNERQTAVDACVAAGYGYRHPRHEECVVNTVAQARAAGRRDAQDTIFGALLLGATLNGASAPLAVPVEDSRFAPLVNRQVNGYQTVCTYRTDTRLVTVVVSGTCPPSYAY